MNKENVDCLCSLWICKRVHENMKKMNDNMQESLYKKICIYLKIISIFFKWLRRLLRTLQWCVLKLVMKLLKEVLLQVWLGSKVVWPLIPRSLNTLKAATSYRIAMLADQISSYLEPHLLFLATVKQHCGVDLISQISHEFTK